MSASPSGPGDDRRGAEDRGDRGHDAYGGAGPPMRVLVFTAPVAEGHLAAARTLSEDIRRQHEDAEVVVCDVLPALRRPVRWFLHDAYRWQLKAAPWLFGSLFAVLHRSRTARFVGRGVLSLVASKALLRLVRRHRPDVVVSTWPPATTVLGCLRLRGKVRVPVCATITDFAGLELWADKGADLHLVMHESLVPDVERLAGPGSARLVSPLVSSVFHARRSATDARSTLGLPREGTIVVVSGGGWAVGDLRGAALTALEIDDAFVVCLSGRDPEAQTWLEDAFRDEPRVMVLGFTDEMSELLAAADVLVHSTGGVTCLEALARGCPIVAYGAPAGHAPLLAQQMSALGLAAYARSPAELRTALLEAGTKRIPRQRHHVDAATLVLAAVPRVTATVRARLARVAGTTATLTAALFLLMASDATYPVVAEALALPESTSVSPSRDAIALVVRGDRKALLALAPIARNDHVRASVAASEPLTRRDVLTLKESGLDPIPALSSMGVSSWFEVRQQLRGQKTEDQVSGSFDYLAPREGFSIGGYLIARHLGGRPIQVESTLPAPGPGAAPVRPGQILGATLASDSIGDLQRLVSAIRRVERSGVRVSSVQRLRRPRGSS
jgi:UDP-N-acetylglucosamine:LPS N-acetylglucosamine transferase